MPHPQVRRVHQRAHPTVIRCRVVAIAVDWPPMTDPGSVIGGPEVDVVVGSTVNLAIKSVGIEEAVPLEEQLELGLIEVVCGTQSPGNTTIID